ncbi:unnamed protein product, partial [Medioppia subpectinata]
MYLYQEEMSEQHYTMASAPLECVNVINEQALTFTNMVRGLFGSAIALDRQCHQYFKATMVNPIYKVNPMVAMTDLVSSAVFRLIRVLGNELGHGAANLFNNLIGHPNYTMSSAPLECVKVINEQALTFSNMMRGLFGWTISLDKQCQQYFKATMVNPIYKVNPMVALTHLVSSAAFRVLGNELGHGVANMFNRIAWADKMLATSAIIFYFKDKKLDPVLFAGTVRLNMDPSGHYGDNCLWKALDAVCLKERVMSMAGALDARVSEGGDNFSVGQRQLLCLARALLRHNRVLVLDEPTANVDPGTDELIQDTIKSRFATCTMLTIVHRLQTIMDSDRVLVLDSGRAVEVDEPYVLLADESGLFSGLVRTTGTGMARKLTEMAKIAYNKRHNTDTDVADNERRLSNDKIAYEGTDIYDKD